ncbi:DNA repair protein NreA [Candidatus Lokiarchaeum ossiferum]|uniref:DNA repair protein n=1 Tax=Candidatus Lokiarchaeum ossiferum TaxID=2951803 RepID=A0ABY6HXV5_9ARCH|nr:DNA repair protein NreA [Candidatus Lokiarchaeum sp. B-35]
MMSSESDSVNICIKCKGARLLCGKSQCPILMKNSILKSTLTIDPKEIKSNQNIFGASPPAVFVGHVGYPRVNIGPLLPIGEYAVEKNTGFLDSPESWFGKPLEEIVKYRSGMVRSNFSIGVRYQDNIDKILGDLNRTNRKMLESTQELTMASNSVDTEAKLSHIRVSMRYDSSSAPNGPSGRAEKIDVIDNVKVLKPVDKVISDKDLKSSEAIYGYLYKSDDISTTSMQRLLSAGLLGVKKNRRLVPTRWAITAVDTIISKSVAKSIKHYPSIDKYYTFTNDYLDNHFIILFMPGPWAFEMNEHWHSESIWNQDIFGLYPTNIAEPVIVNDYELENGRKKYADNITGAYYAARKEIVEFLSKSRRQSRAIVFREIRGGYILPLGVWVIRETVRQALQNGWKGSNVIQHESLKDALQVINNRFKVPLKHWLKASKLVPYSKTQKRLDFWIKN